MCILLVDNVRYAERIDSCFTEGIGADNDKTKSSMTL